MSLPNNEASIVVVRDSILTPDSFEYAATSSYELGGRALQTPINGEPRYVWRCRYENGNVILANQSGADTTWLTGLPPIVSLDFSLDQNMNPAIAYEHSNNSYFYWYDAAAEGYVTSVYANTRSPRLTRDDKRQAQTPYSDLLIGYITDYGTLMFRQQRERFLVERPLTTGVPEKYNLKKIAMQNNYRLIFLIESEAFLPLCEIPIQA